jgi:Flp pilus assembly pilin Flp
MKGAGSGKSSPEETGQSRSIGYSGQSLAEYALILLLVALVCISTMTLLGTTLGTMFSTIASSF